MVKDVTESFAHMETQKKLTEQLLQSEKLSAVGQLAAGIAHEFNNILAIILAIAKYSLLDDSINNEIKENLIEITKQVTRGADIVAGMISFGKPQKPERRPSRIENIFNTSIKLQEKQLKFEKIKIEKNFFQDTEILIDPIQMQQVFINLINNSRHAIRPNGSGVITVNGFEKDGAFHISFRDNGIGMNNEIKKKIFTPFFTTKGAFSKNNYDIKGAGLGLVVIHTIIVKNHSGKISFESEENKGTVFNISIPFPKNTEASIKATNTKNTFSLEYKGNPLNVLIIDDEKIMSEILKRIIEKVGCSVDTAESGEKGISMLNYFSYDLILLDNLMPGKNGLEIMDIIKFKHPETQVVMISGNPSADKNKIISKHNLLGYLSKPFVIEEIVRLLEKASNKIK